MLLTFQKTRKHQLRHQETTAYFLTLLSVSNMLIEFRLVGTQLVMCHLYAIYSYNTVSSEVVFFLGKSILYCTEMTILYKVQKVLLWFSN